MLAGECAVTIKWDEMFKGLQFNSSFKGSIGSVVLPGWTEVLDRSTGMSTAAFQWLAHEGAEGGLRGTRGGELKAL